MADETRIVGIDVSKDRLDVHVLETEKTFSVDNTKKGWKTLKSRLAGARAPAVGLEASGGYEKGVAEALFMAGFTVYILNAKQVKAFARGVACHAKTDPLDARLIARCLETNLGDAHPWIPDPHRNRLMALVSHRETLVAEKTAVGGRLDKENDEIVQEMMRRHLAFLHREIAAVEKEIRKVVRESPLLRHLAQLLTSAPGVGPVLSWIILARLPEIGRIDSRALAGLVGVAPYDRQSGRRHRPGQCHGGRSYVRRILYMATLNAVNGSNPPLARFYQSKLSEGKPAKVALVTCMRKLLLMLNAMVRNDRQWQHA